MNRRHVCIKEHRQDCRLETEQPGQPHLITPVMVDGIVKDSRQTPPTTGTGSSKIPPAPRRVQQSCVLRIAHDLSRHETPNAVKLHESLVHLSACTRIEDVIPPLPQRGQDVVGYVSNL